MHIFRVLPTKIQKQDSQNLCNCVPWDALLILLSWGKDFTRSNWYQKIKFVKCKQQYSKPTAAFIMYNSGRLVINQKLPLQPVQIKIRWQKKCIHSLIRRNTIDDIQNQQWKAIVLVVFFPYLVPLLNQVVSLCCWHFLQASKWKSPYLITV